METYSQIVNNKYYFRNIIFPEQKDYNKFEILNKSTVQITALHYLLGVSLESSL